ncbi:MAG: MXAN_6640 family putative metalloprotease [Bacteroidota bacterium]
MGMRINILTVIFFSALLFAQEPGEKCGTYRQVQLITQAKIQQIELPVVTRPILQKSIVTKNQKIRIHYDTSGSNTPAMVDAAGNRVANSSKKFIDTLSVILDSVWHAEIDSYGFTEPPKDSGRGNGNEFDFYVLELSQGLFGETIIETDFPVGPTKTNQQYATYIRIDNDFGAGYRTKGVQAILATTAHEFHHAIQVGGSGVWESDQFYFYEICAEAMENTVFNEAKDYIFDVRTYFKNISSVPLFIRSQSNYPGYERAIWGMFLMKKYGTSIMKEIWNEMKLQQPVPALNAALNKYSTSIQREYSDFSYWNFFTAHRADSIRYYSDAKILPSVALSNSLVATSVIQDHMVISESFASNYYKISVANDSSFFIISNTHYQDGIGVGQQSLSAKLSYTSSSSSGFPSVSKSIFAAFTPSEPQFWSYISVGNKSFGSCFPNPFNPSTSSFLISLDGIGALSDATLSIVSASTMDLVFSNTAKYTTFSGTQYAEWKGRDNKGNIVSSGIYLYILAKGSSVIKGKFAIIR